MLDFIKSEPGSNREICLTSCDGGYKKTGIKEEKGHFQLRRLIMC
jgi:hypothetical protein